MISYHLYAYRIFLSKLRTIEFQKGLFTNGYNKAVTPIIDFCDDFEDCKLEVDVWFEIHSLNES